MKYFNQDVEFHYEKDGEKCTSTISFVEEDAISSEDPYFANHMLEYFEADGDEIQWRYVD